MPCNTSNTLLTSSLLGFAGGDETLHAHKVAMVEGRGRLPALYNSPGSYGAGKGYLSLSQAQVWDGLYPGVTAEPTALTSTTETTHGPKYTATFSGTVMNTTGPIAKLLMEHARSLQTHVVEGRVTTPFSVTIEHPVARARAPVIIPVAVSAASAAACGVIGDWPAFALIVLGMLANGAASSFLQGGDLTFTRPASTPGVPAGDGYLESGTEMVVLKGSESAVASVTRGRFTLRFKDESALKRVGWGGKVLTFQCFAQLIFVPFGSFFGQLFFLFSMAVSWIYNAYVASQEKEASKRLVLEDLLKAPNMKRYSLGTRTTAVVFLMQVLKPNNVEEQLAALLPNNTPVWKTWRQTVARRLQEEKPTFADAHLHSASTFTTEETKLLGTLFGDAQAAVDAYAKFSRSKY
ncbi:hypothetical protein C8Q74DRAFT_1225588 [Fomes fomentarius]|nr:hypothetical protein C8Q74DRAFT_1225588 [Fomes fomentarius]